MATLPVLLWLRENNLIPALLLFTIMDYISGVMAGFVTKKLSSDIGLHGIMRKIGVYMLLAVAAVLDQIQHALPMLNLCAMFFISVEGMSILENLGNMGVPLPPQLKEAFVKMRMSPTPPAQAVTNMTVNNGPVTANVLPAKEGDPVITLTSP